MSPSRGNSYSRLLSGEKMLPNPQSPLVIKDELWPDSINHDPSMLQQPQSKPNLTNLPSSRPQDHHSLKHHEVRLISCNTSKHPTRLPSQTHGHRSRRRRSRPPAHPTFILSQLGAFVGGREGFSDPSRLDERDVSSIRGGSQPQLDRVRK